MRYDEFGNVIFDDEVPTVPQMRAELAKSKPESQKSAFTGLYGPFIEKVVAPYVEPALSVATGAAAPVIAAWDWGFPLCAPSSNSTTALFG